MSNQPHYSVLTTTEVKETCPECNRVFDLYDLDDADEWFNGHDCEVDE
jgi:hypothetical protein